jgi:hypothetical protein
MNARTSLGVSLLLALFISSCSGATKSTPSLRGEKEAATTQLNNVNTAGAGPKYKPGPFHQALSSTNCTGRCAAGPMLFTPEQIDVCEGQQVQVNLRIQGNRMSKAGDQVENSGGLVDWGDGKEEGLAACCSWDLIHVYQQATAYHPSATFGEQCNNANNPRGGCSYRCRLQQAAEVTVHMKGSPECRTGKFNPKIENTPKTGKSGKKKH